MRDSKPRLVDALLDAAELHFGTQGPDNVSLRQIAITAGSANHNAVQYYFSDRETLVRAIFERRLSSLDLKRGTLLAAAIGRGQERDLTTLLHALFAPIAEETDASGRCSYAIFLLGIRVFSRFTRWRTEDMSPPIARELNSLLRAQLAFLPDDVFGERMTAAATTFLAAVVDWDRSTQGGAALGADKRRHLALALEFAAAGLAASHSR